MLQFYRRRRALAILAAVGLLAAVATAAGLSVWPAGLPDPAVADREQLVQWIVTRDLAREPAQTRSVLAGRLEEEFGTGADWQALDEKLNDEHRRRLWANVPLLLRCWVTEKADRFARLRESERMAFLDRLLETLDAWRGIEQLRPQTVDAAGETPAAKRGLFETLLAEVERRKAEAGNAERQRIDELMLALQARWLMRSLPALFAPPS